jgi:hypothetical protein
MARQKYQVFLRKICALTRDHDFSETNILLKLNSPFIYFNNNRSLEHFDRSTVQVKAFIEKLTALPGM